MHQGRALKKTKNTFIFTTVITGYIISVFLCVGSWCHIEKENKGKKENSKTTGLQKSQKKEKYYPVKEKKIMSYKKLKSVTFGFQKHEIGRCKMHININMSRRTNSKCYLQKILDTL